MVFALAALPGPVLQATVMRELSIEELSARSSHVVRGTVLGQVSRWSEDRKGILTYVDVAVHEQVKGAPPLPGVIQIVQPGGELDGVRMKIVGGPVFHDGEEVFLFLKRYWDSPGTEDMTILVGGVMGRLPVLRDPEGIEEPVVARRYGDADFARFVPGEGGQRLEIGEGPPPSVMTLDEFRWRVREAEASLGRPGRRREGSPHE